MIIKIVPVKDDTSKIATTLSTVYRFQKIWNKYQKIPKKRNCAKKDVLKVERTLFLVKLADNFAPMISEQMRENLIKIIQTHLFSKHNFIISFKNNAF